MKVDIVKDSVGVIEGNLYEVMGEDSMLQVFDYMVIAEGVDGNEYLLGQKFKAWSVDEKGIPCIDYSFEDVLKNLIPKIENRGVINLDYWVDYVRGPSYALGEVDEVSLMDDDERFHRGYA